MKINDISIKNKFVIIYIAGLLLPLIIINSLIISRYQTTTREQYRRNIGIEMDRMEMGISSVISNGYYVLQKLYTDRGLYGIMDSEYVENRDFVITYNGLFNSTVLSFLTFFDEISSLIIFTSNPTILNAGSMRKINDRIEQESWYHPRLNSQSAQIVTWNGSNYEYGNSEFHISIIHPLNYYSSYDNYFHFMKADIKASAFIELLSERQEEASLFLVDRYGETILGVGHQEPNMHYILETREITDSSGDVLWTLNGYYPKSPIFIISGDWRDLVLPVTVLMLLLSSSFLILWISRSLTIRMNRFTDHIRSQKTTMIPVLNVNTNDLDEIGELIGSFNQMLQRITQLIIDVRRSEEEKRQIELERNQAELHALQSQVNPHYLYNTLETIRMKSVLKEEFETAEILQMLSSSYRRMFTWGSGLVTVRESLFFLSEYLEIQKYRLGSRLSYRLNAQEHIMDCPIPKLIIQPLVENACRHGFVNEEASYRLDIDLEEIDGKIQVTVEDDGVGMKEDLVAAIMESLESKESMTRFVGFRNVYSRLKSHYGSCLFEIVSRSDTGTRIIWQMEREPFLGSGTVVSKTTQQTGLP